MQPNPVRFLCAVLCLFNLVFLFSSGCGHDGGGGKSPSSDGDSDFETGVLDPRVPPTSDFPYVFDNDDPVYDNPDKAYLLIRAEGKSLDETAEHAYDYLRKFEEKKYSAPSAELRYFEHQKELFAVLKNMESMSENSVAVTLGIVGDIMWIRRGWNSFLGEDVLKKMRQLDFILGNLETPIAESFEIPDALPNYSTFNSHPALLRSFRDENGKSLFKALSFANNHTLDREDLEAVETLDFLESEGILSAGVREQPGSRWASFEVKGLSFGFYSATWGLNEPSLLETTTLDISIVPGFAPPGVEAVDVTEIREVMSEMEQAGVDFKIVYLHWGYEYELYPDSLQVVATREIVYAGADLLIGSHTHVQQPLEICFVNGYESALLENNSDLSALKSPQGCILKDKTGRKRKALILYSLGNFVSRIGTVLGNLGLIEKLGLFRREDGAVDWNIPTHEFVYNLREYPPDNTQRLMLLNSYLENDCFPESEACPEETLSKLEYIKAHLFDMEAR